MRFYEYFSLFLHLFLDNFLIFKIIFYTGILFLLILSQ